MLGIPLGFSDRKMKERTDGDTVWVTNTRVITTPQARDSAVFDNRLACEGRSNYIQLDGDKLRPKFHPEDLLLAPDLRPSRD